MCVAAAQGGTLRVNVCALRVCTLSGAGTMKEHQLIISTAMRHHQKEKNLILLAHLALAEEGVEVRREAQRLAEHEQPVCGHVEAMQRVQAWHCCHALPTC